MSYHGRAQMLHCWGFVGQPQIIRSALQGLKEAMKGSQDEASLIRWQNVH